MLIETGSPAETEALGRVIGGVVFPGACLALYGDLGAGKTVLARGLARGLGVDERMRVTSPTFVIVSEYDGRLAMHHVDAYRLKGACDIVDLGSRELFYGDAVSVVEWADRIAGAIPDDRLDLRMEVSGETTRTITVSAAGPTHRKLVPVIEGSLAALSDISNT